MSNKTSQLLATEVSVIQKEHEEHILILQQQQEHRLRLCRINYQLALLGVLSAWLLREVINLWN